MRWLILESDLLDEIGRPDVPLRDDPVIRLIERHRIVERDRTVVVVEAQLRKH